MLQGEQCQEREEEHYSALIYKVPRNICVGLLRHLLCQSVGYFSFQPPLSVGRGGSELELV